MAKLSVDYFTMLKPLLPKDKKISDQELLEFSFMLQGSLPILLGVTQVFDPTRDEARIVHKHANNLFETLSELRELYETSAYTKDIINSTLRDKADRLDFLDIYWFSDGLKGFTDDEMKKIKPGKDNRIPLRACECIAWYYEKYLGYAPGCYSNDRIRESGDVNAGTPYERICHAISQDLGLDITWSTMRKALETYRETYTKAKIRSS